MQIIDKKLTDLKPYTNNPRHNAKAVPAVKESILKFGFKVPLVIDKNNVIVCGHTRFYASKEIGLETVPCIVADDLTDEQINAFRLVDNRVSEFADWNFDKLAEELSDLQDFDFEPFGFDELMAGLGTQYNPKNKKNKNNKDENEEDFLENEEVDVDDETIFQTGAFGAVLYGVPYKGSKSRLAEKICDVLPAGKRLVDLFGGGGAITHRALLLKKWESVLYNDINTMITDLFINAINGEYKNYKRIVTREDFEKYKDIDPYVKYVCSYGAAGEEFLWSKKYEKIMYKIMEMLFCDDFQKARLCFRKVLSLICNYIEDEKNSNLERFGLNEQLSRLDRVNQLEGLQRLNGINNKEFCLPLETSNVDYREYKYKNGDVVYCDIPYENTQGYNKECFNHQEFYEWCKKQPFQIFFSSYKISDDSFYVKKIGKCYKVFKCSKNCQKRDVEDEFLYSNMEF